MLVEEQTQNQAEATADPQGDGSLDEAAAAFAARGRGAEPGAQEGEQQAVQEGADAEAVDSEAEPDEGDPADDTQAEGVETFEHDGLEITVKAGKAEAAKKALLRQADYSRKMNEVSDQAKAAQAQIAQAQKLAEGAEKYAEVLAEARMLDAQIKQYEGVDWAAIRKENPAEFAAMAAELQGLRLTRQEASAKAQKVQSELESERAAGLNEKRASMVKALQKDLPGWGEELGTQITQYAIGKGWTAEDLTLLTDARVVIALDKARKFDNIEAGKANALKKAQAAPQVLKPGAVRPRTNAAEDAMARFRKSNSEDDAVAVFLARSKR